jgi:hypothetical protein
MNIKRMQLAPEVRNTLLQFASAIGMEKHTSPTYTFKMAAEISFVNLVPNYSTTQQYIQKDSIL